MFVKHLIKLIWANFGGGGEIVKKKNSNFNYRYYTRYVNILLGPSYIQM